MDRDDEILLVAEQAVLPGESIRTALVGTLEVDSQVVGVGALLLTQRRLLFVQPNGSSFDVELRDFVGPTASSDGRVLQFSAAGKPSRLIAISKGSPADLVRLTSSPLVPTGPARMERQPRHGINCPNCGIKTPEAGFAVWQILVAICFFPVGLLAFVAGKEPTTCRHCQYTFKT